MQKSMITITKPVNILSIYRCQIALAEPCLSLNRILRLFALIIPVMISLLGCASIKPTVSRNQALDLSERASKAEFWVLSHQRSSGDLPYFFDPAVDGEVGKRHAFGELIAAHRNRSAG